MKARPKPGQLWRYLGELKLDNVKHMYVVIDPHRSRDYVLVHDSQKGYTEYSLNDILLEDTLVSDVD